MHDCFLVSWRSIAFSNALALAIPSLNSASSRALVMFLASIQAKRYNRNVLDIVFFHLLLPAGSWMGLINETLHAGACVFMALMTGKEAAVAVEHVAQNRSHLAEIPMDIAFGQSHSFGYGVGIQDRTPVPIPSPFIGIA